MSKLFLNHSDDGCIPGISGTYSERDREARCKVKHRWQCTHRAERAAMNGLYVGWTCHKVSTHSRCRLACNYLPSSRREAIPSLLSRCMHLTLCSVEAPPPLHQQPPCRWYRLYISFEVSVIGPPINQSLHSVYFRGRYFSLERQIFQVTKYSGADQHTFLNPVEVRNPSAVMATTKVGGQ